MSTTTTLPGAKETERRQFRMDPALLWSVIQSQAGTAEKALLEGVMNAVDAGATKCEITIDEMGYTVVDDGTGFKSRHEIESFFETFGTPHKEGDAKYGTYRMGRGQLFAFSKTNWESGEFSMQVDIKGLGLEYDLHTNSSPAPGCRIVGTWYERIDMAEVIRIGHDLSQLAQWMQIPVFVNGRKISKDASEQAWSQQTDDAYFKFKGAGGLAVYNLGALVRVFPAHQFGISGVIVTKKRLAVNFARNDILTSQCDVWRRLRRILDKHCGTLTERKTQLSDHEYEALARRFARGEMTFREVASIGLIGDVSGKRRSLHELADSEKVCIVPEKKDWSIGERVMNQKLAFVMRMRTLHQFGVDTLEEFLTLLKDRTTPSKEAIDYHDSEKALLRSMQSKLQEFVSEVMKQKDPLNRYVGHADHPKHAEYMEMRRANDEQEQIVAGAAYALKYKGKFDHLRIVSIEEVSAHISDQYNLLEEKGLPPHQKALLEGLKEVSRLIGDFGNRQRFQRLSKEEQRAAYESLHAARAAHVRKARTVMVGESDVAAGWTDGETYIAVNKDCLRDVLANKKSVSWLVALMVHEYCHDETDACGHVHSPEFFEQFHEWAMESYLMEMCRYKLVQAYAKAIKSLDKKPNAVLMSEIKWNSKSLGVSIEQ